MAKSYEMDMCNGPILGKVLTYSIPLMLSGVLQLLFNAADVIVVGRFAGSQSLAGSILSPSPDSTVRSPAYFSRISSSLHAFLFWTSSTEPQYSHFFNPSF